MNPYMQVVAIARSSAEAACLALRQLSSFAVPGVSWDRERLEEVLEFHLNVEPSVESIRSLASSDAINILHGISCVSNDERRGRLLGAFIRQISWANNQGIQLINGRKRALAATAVAALFRIEDASWMGGETKVAQFPEQFELSSLAAFALQVSNFGRVKVECASQRLRCVVRGFLLLHLRKRSLTEAALALIAYSLLFPDDEAKFAEEWIKRNTRSDGLIGVWELFGNKDAAALLHGSAWINFAANLRASARSIKTAAIQLADPVDAEQSVSKQDLTSALRRCLGWTQRNRAEFHVYPACEELSEFGDKVKPLVEVMLLLFVLKHISTTCSDLEWLESYVDEMSKEFAVYDSWEGLPEAIRIFPTSILVALAFPLLERITGQRSRFYEEIESLVSDRFSQAQERIPMRQMDYWYLRWLFRPTPEFLRMIDLEFERTLCASDCNPAYFSNDSMYDVTHAVFYKTCFGMRADVSIEAELQQRLGAMFDSLGVSVLLDQDPDLGAELLMCNHFIGRSKCVANELMAQMLCASIDEDGSVPGPVRSREAELSEFEKRYHTTLVVAAALAQTISSFDSR